MYWRIPNVKNIDAGHLFTDKDSFYRFIRENEGVPYRNLRQRCTAFYGKTVNSDYFGQIITHFNFNGFLQLNEQECVESNLFLRYLEEHPQWIPAYLEYFLCMWQFPMPNVKNFREDAIHKPYLMLLKLLLELKAIDADEAYLNREDFYFAFLEEGNRRRWLSEVNAHLAGEIIRNRGIQPEVEARKTQYFRALLEHSALLTTDAGRYGGDRHFFIGLGNLSFTEREIKYLLKTYSTEVFAYDHTRSSSDKEVISEYAEYLNCFERFEKWKRTVMTIRRLEEFHTYCLEQGFYYTKELVRRFILSLETKPFVLLTGISGSGKTKIAELWMKYLMELDEADGILIAVGSNWTDNKKLLGFENILAEKKDRYRATELVVKMRSANEDREKELIVILDEMNLSRVELYFADYLSALESMSHEILLPDGSRISWTANIKIIGTVNVDETTYMFSPKVLDRANVIEMNGMPPEEYIQAVYDKPGKIYQELTSYAWYQELYLPLLQQIYEAVGGEFAYRVIDEMSEYVLLNAKLCGDEPEDFKCYMDEQVSQKILSRLHGSKSQLKPKLDRLQQIFGVQEDYALVNAKLTRMLSDVQKGYASYIGG